MSFTAQELIEALSTEYKMTASVLPLGQDVTFFGTELECYKMAYKFKNKENTVKYSENLSKWYVSFPQWFDLGFSQMIES